MAPWEGAGAPAPCAPVQSAVGELCFHCDDAQWAEGLVGARYRPHRAAVLRALCLERQVSLPGRNYLQLLPWHFWHLWPKERTWTSRQITGLGLLSCWSPMCKKFFEKKCICLWVVEGMYLLYVMTSLKCKVHVTNLQLIALDGSRRLQRPGSPGRWARSWKGGRLAGDMGSPRPHPGTEVSQKVCLLPLTVSVLWKIQW